MSVATPATPTARMDPSSSGLTRRWRRIRQLSTPYLFLVPFFLVFFVFVVLPLIYSLNLSLYRSRLVGGKAFVGAENYIKAIQDPAFWEGVRNVLVFGAMQIPVMLGLALLFALVLDSGIVRRQTIYRLGFFLPFAVPSVVAALVWGYLYGQSFGPIAQLARALGLEPPVFLTKGTIIPAIANIATWQYTGYNMLIMFAALKAIPRELYEAARVDGANGFQIAWHIRIPLIAPAVLLTLIFSIIGTLQLFNEPRVLRDVSPTSISANFTPNLYVYYQAFANRQFDYSAAIAFSLALVTAVLTAVVLAVTYRRQAFQ
jgi:multiple sugar transport system permease protein